MGKKIKPGSHFSQPITVIEPVYSFKGLNDFKCMLHVSPELVDFTLVNKASMYLRPRLDSPDHTSSGNLNRVYSGNGIYRGKVNFDYSGGWKLCDSLYCNNRLITQDGTPYKYFQGPYKRSKLFDFRIKKRVLLNIKNKYIRKLSLLRGELA